MFCVKATNLLGYFFDYAEHERHERPQVEDTERQKVLRFLAGVGNLAASWWRSNAPGRLQVALAVGKRWD